MANMIIRLKGLPTAMDFFVLSGGDLRSLRSLDRRRNEYVDTVTPETMAMRQELKREIKLLLEELPAKEAFVLWCYFGLDDRGERRVSEISRVLKLSKMRVYQLLHSGLRKLRHPYNSRRLREFIDFVRY